MNMQKGQIPFWKAALGGFVAGLTGGILMLATAAFLRTYLGSPSATELIFDRSFPLVSVDFFIQQINRFGGYVPLKIAGVVASLSGQLLAAALGGLAYAMIMEAAQRRRNDDRRGWIDPLGWKLGLAGLLVVWIGLLTFLRPTLGTQYYGVPSAIAPYLTSLGLLIEFGVCAASILVLYGYLTHRRQFAPESKRTLLADRKSRRAFIHLAVTALGAVAFGGLLRRLRRTSTIDYDGNTYEGPDVEFITPNEDFYSVTKNLVDPDVAQNIWRLEIAGAVDEPRTYSFAELTSLPATEQLTTLCCISNPVGGGLMSNARWKGVPLPSILGAAKPKAGLEVLLFHAADGYYETFPIAKAFEPTTLLAYEMNGKPIPQIHGFPLRLIVPGLYGEKNPKWLTKIELLTANDPRLKKTHGCGFYKEQGWGPNFVVPTNSRIDAPEVTNGKFTEELKLGQSTEFRGIAFGGDRGVQKVELSFDGAKSWREANIVEPGTQISWSTWSYEWRPESPGEYVIAVRATDGTGAQQISEDRGTVPQGATGLQRVQAFVRG
jgi:DMSO/TMAO reductase YedYZ molybdopterin-dependent catalytic subunit